MSGSEGTPWLVATRDGCELDAREWGQGAPVIFVHELLGNGATFAPVIDRLKSRFRCITYNARGYPPSQVPAFSEQRYSQTTACDDLLAVMDQLGLQRAHLVGVSMGAACCLQLAIAAPQRVQSMVLASIGAGSDATPEAQAARIEGMAAQFDGADMAALLRDFATRPNRRTLIDNQPESWRLFEREFMKLSGQGIAHTLRGVQKRRAPIYALEPALRELRVPALVVLGSEDAPCRKPCEFLARTLPAARLEVIEGSGHTPNLEQPERFAQLCLQALTSPGGAA
jgi:pimeloyl-ACP methyl ester carboxylesterase